jgi:N-acetylglucosamine-6-phosphate deacetylase
MATALAYFDLQVNGYGGVDFNQDELTAEQLHQACAKLEADGVAGILATIITEHLEVMCRRLARVVELRERDELAKKLIAGISHRGAISQRDHGISRRTSGGCDPARGYRFMSATIGGGGRADARLHARAGARSGP